MLLEAVKRAEAGLIDADLGAGLIKHRVARAGAGNSGAFRSIVVFKKLDKAFFIYRFAKNERGTLKPNEKTQYRNGARILLALTPAEPTQLLANGTLEKIEHNEQKVPLERTRRS